MSDDNEAPAKMSKQGFDRGIARIIYELETIREEGRRRSDGTPTWYAMDRLEQIRITAKLLIEGNELACIGDPVDYGGPPEDFDRHQETEINRPTGQIDELYARMFGGPKGGGR